MQWPWLSCLKHAWMRLLGCCTTAISGPAPCDFERPVRDTIFLSFYMPQDVAAALFDSLGESAQKDYLLHPSTRGALVAQHRGTSQMLAGAAALAQGLSDRSVVVLHYILDEDGSLQPCHMAEVASRPTATGAAAAASACAAGSVPALAGMAAVAVEQAVGVQRFAMLEQQPLPPDYR